MKTVTFTKKKSKLIVSYEFDQTLYKIMKSNDGHYIKIFKHWSFPIEKLDALKKEIIKAGYQVSIQIKKDDGCIVVENVFDDPDVIAVYGKCKACGAGGFVGKDGLCVRCR